MISFIGPCLGVLSYSQTNLVDLVFVMSPHIFHCLDEVIMFIPLVTIVPWSFFITVHVVREWVVGCNRSRGRSRSSNDYTLRSRLHFLTNFLRDLFCKHGDIFKCYITTNIRTETNYTAKQVNINDWSDDILLEYPWPGCQRNLT